MEANLKLGTQCDTAATFALIQDRPGYMNLTPGAKYDPVFFHSFIEYEEEGKDLVKQDWTGSLQWNRLDVRDTREKVAFAELVDSKAGAFSNGITHLFLAAAILTMGLF